MTQEKKLGWIRKVVPVAYLLGMALVCGYLAYRMRCWGNLLVPWETGYLTGMLMAAFFILSLSVSRDYLVAGSRGMTWVAGVSSFIVMMLSLSVLGCDLVQLAIRPLLPGQAERETVLFVCGCLCIVFVAVMTAVGMRQANRLKIVPYSVPCPGMEQRCRMVLLSDLHIGYYVGVRHMQRVVEAVNGLRPDIVVIAGDLINAGNTRECPEIDRAAEVLSGLRSRMGTFAITGNHDPDASDRDFQEFLEKAKITLIDEKVINTKQFHLVGRRNCQKPRRSLAGLCKEIADDLPVLVVDHDPQGIREAEAEGAALVMCGHTHKGQIFPMNLFVRVLYSRAEFWGYSRRGNTSAVVSAGTGYFSMPMRIGSSCEIVDLNLHP